ncbi:tripartite motif-containing protein 59-like [Ruditapes philippinarum]|uniref:tripartite motif-containing protein 59-like n=1 Tax=Ruditapes philippinarum TaxID=129788 RepID=UPI00295B51AF|nr:tripartite motif-containing protein 59-like [Ruditapes philippinarum]
MATSSTYCDSTDTVYFKCSESLITCQLCTDKFESPRILPCQHTFCKKCVVSLLTMHCLDDNGNTRKTSFPCPNCRRECKIRQKGKHSIEAHLKCFPESLLLNTVLESVVEKPRGEFGKVGKETENYNSKCSCDKNDDKQKSQVKEIEKRQICFNILCSLHVLLFLTHVHLFCLNSLKTVSKSTYVFFFKKLLAIFRIKNAMNINKHPDLKQFDIESNAAEEAAQLERQTNLFIDNIDLTEENDTEIILKNAQTQTEDADIAFPLLSKLVIKSLLVKNSSIVQWLLNYLFEKRDIKVVDFSLCISVQSRKIIFWYLLIKLFDIFTMLYIAKQSFTMPFFLFLMCYVILLVFSKRIKLYVDRGLYIRSALPLFPIFLICLNFFSNLNRCILYLSCLVFINFWLLVRLLFFEFLPYLTIFATFKILDFCNKGHLARQYGPCVQIISVKQKRRNIFL